MGFWKFFTGLLGITCMAVCGIYFYISGEMEYLKVFVPPIDNITSYNQEISFTIFGAGGLEMYKKYYRRSEKLPEDYDISKLILIVDQIIEERRASPQTYGIERWKLLLIKHRGVDPFSLKGVVLDHYADNLLSENKLSGFRGEIVRWYTLDRLNNAYAREGLYRMYLDAPSYGNEIYGISAASTYYLGKPVSEANLLELAFLVGILSGNKPLNPLTDYTFLDKYARVALRNLYESGHINSEEFASQISGKVMIAIKEYPIIEPSYVEEVLKIIAKDNRFKVGKESLRIYTGYNKHASDTIREVLDKSLKGKDEKLQMSFALVNRETLAVEAVVGSRVLESRRNRAVNLRRQMASTFKPIVYMTAFEQGFKPSDHIEDKPYTFNSGGFLYSPRNYEDVFLGDIPIRYGLIYSLNNATVKMAEMTGLSRVKDMAVNIGMESKIMPFHAMALGSFAATPLNVAQMYSTVANYGIRRKPSIILRVETGSGAVIDMTEKPKRVVSESAAYQTVYAMQDVPRRGTGRSAGFLSGTAAKTGTSDKFRDAWTVALFGSYVAVCWVGYDDFTSMGGDGSGGRIAAPVVARFQQAYFDNGTSFNFEPPEGIVFSRVNSRTGLLTEKSGKGTYIEAYKKGKLPATEKLKKSR